MTALRETAPDEAAGSNRRGRRGIIAGAAAFAAGLLAKEAAPERIAASSGNGPDGFLVMGSDGGTYTSNLVTRRSLLETTTGFRGYGIFEAYGAPLSAADITANGGGVDGLRATGAGNGAGLNATGGGNSGAGVRGVGGAIGTAARPGIGVLGLANGATDPSGIATPAGVYGSGRGASKTGVRADSDNAVALHATSDTGLAVYAVTEGSALTTAAVYASGQRMGVYGVANGINLMRNDDVYGVYGSSYGGPNHNGVAGATDSGRGVFGNASGGTGVYGTSTTGVGVLGVSGGGATGQPYGVVGSVSGAPGFALYGVTTVAGTVAFAGGTTVVGGIAGQLSGPVNIYNTGPGIPGNLYVQGNSTVSGTKSAAVPHPDGSHRLLYCMEAPEAWFEDFGEGTLTGGKATVTLDPDFAAVVDTSTLHVFITEHDEHHLHVPQRSATGFTVLVSPLAAKAAGVDARTVSGTFTWRVVAKRKDVAAPRLGKFAVPQEIKAPALVIPPAPPPPPPAFPAPGGTKG